jgi:hypothetical protein
MNPTRYLPSYASVPATGYRAMPVVWRTWTSPTTGSLVAAPSVAQPPATRWQTPSVTPIVSVGYAALTGYAPPIARPVLPAARTLVQIGQVTIDYSVLQ